MIRESQLPAAFRQVVSDEIAIYQQGRTVTVVDEIPDTTAIPIADRKHWLRIPDVICVFVDMQGSTQLSAATKDKTTAGAYQLFTETAVRLFHSFDAPYIDVRGDGVFALFNRGQAYRALAATVTFKTFVEAEFTPRVERDTGHKVGGHYGIDSKTVLVRKLGLKRRDSRTDRQNEVWAGKPVNMAAKLAAQAPSGELWVSDRFYNQVPNDVARLSCGCGSWGSKPAKLWTKKDVWADKKFDFEAAYSIASCWCPTHGAEFCSRMLAL